MHQVDAKVFGVFCVRSSTDAYRVASKCCTLCPLLFSISPKCIGVGLRSLRQSPNMVTAEQQKQASRKLTHWLENDKKIVSHGPMYVMFNPLTIG